MASVPTTYRVPRTFQKEIEQGKYTEDGSLPGNRFLELKALRPSQRAHAILNKLIADPENRTDLTGAITVVGTCLDMCPEFERHEREFQKDVDEWEKIPGTSPKRIDHIRAVKKYRRSAAGNEDPLPSDLRPPHILKKTLDYLLEDLLPTHGLAATYAFIRDRTRAIRTDFVIQHVKGPIVIECFERIARFHILAVHAFCDPEGVARGETKEIRGFDYWLEVEQMMKTLQSLIQFYDDRLAIDPQLPNEAEFRAYYLLAHIRSNSILRRLHSLPQHIFLSPIIQSALEFRAHAQSLAAPTGGPGSGSTHKSRTKSLAASPPLQNFFTRFFKRIESPATSYLLACMLEYHFGGVRKGAVHALWKAYSTRHRGIPIQDVVKMLGFSDPNTVNPMEGQIKAEEVVRKFGMGIETDSEDSEKRVVLNRHSTFDYTAQITQRHSSNLVEPKRGRLSDIEIVNGGLGITGGSIVQTIPEIPTALAFQDISPPLPTPSVTAVPTSLSFSSSSFTSDMTLSKTQINRVPAERTPNPPPFGVFLGAENRSPSTIPFGSNIAPAFAFKNVNVMPSYVHPISAFVSSSLPPATQSIPPQVIPAAVAEVGSGRIEDASARKRQATALKEQKSRHAEEQERELRTQMKEKKLQLLEKEKRLAEEEKLRREQEEQARLEEEERNRRDREERRQREREEEERRMAEFELQEKHRRERRERRVIADLWFLSRIFERWKRIVIKKGESRVAFKKSILEMGMSAGPSDDRLTPRSSKKHAEFEDVLPWEDISEFSISTSHIHRGRKSKGKKRMDDEAILEAIKDAEKTRLRLWERGSFLRFVKETRCQGDVWLSTSPLSVSTGEWLRVKFNVEIATEDPVICIPNRDGHGPGLVIVDLTPSDDESVIQLDLIRIRHIFSQLPSDRYYTPSVLILQWIGHETLPVSISNEVNTLLENQVIMSVRILAFNNDDLNDQFLHALKEVSFDTVGRLVKRISLEDVFGMFFQLWDSKLSEELERCRLGHSDYSPSPFNWLLYGQIVQVFMNLLPKLAEKMSAACRIKMMSDIWPEFDGSAIVDQLSAYQTFIDYMESSWLVFEESAVLLKTELIVDMDNNKNFEVRSIPGRLAYIVLFRFQRSTSTPQDSHFCMDVHGPLPNLREFLEDIHSAIATISENRTPQKESRKRSSVTKTAKRYKRDDAVDTVNGDSGHSIEGDKKELSINRPNALTRLKSSIMKARQSVEELRASRKSCEGRQHYCLTNVGSDSPSRPDMEPLQRMSFQGSPSSLDSEWRFNDLDSASFLSNRNISNVDNCYSSYGASSRNFQRRNLIRPSPSKSLVSLQKPATNGMMVVDDLRKTIERAKQTIQEARKTRQNDVGIK
ncbi:hypothetical protein Clacol_008418 [Clathrus columnatus]|uniref:PCI domain-containing protein n=1 Tax=Clathrus columnatus TaxID=1419009 RepID=A0AAV5ANA6_9AGAM|nr:hypothetical protein Clacol_008418 [Clathrus columnatus]